MTDNQKKHPNAKVAYSATTPSSPVQDYQTVRLFEPIATPGASKLPVVRKGKAPSGGLLKRLVRNFQASQTLVNKDANRKTPNHLRGVGLTPYRLSHETKWFAPGEEPRSRGGLLPPTGAETSTFERYVSARRELAYQAWSSENTVFPVVPESRALPQATRVDHTMVRAGKKRSLSGKSTRLTAAAMQVAHDNAVWFHNQPAPPPGFVPQMGHARAMRRNAAKPGGLKPAGTARVMTLVRDRRVEWLRAYGDRNAQEAYLEQWPRHRELMRQSFTCPSTRHRVQSAHDSETFQRWLAGPFEEQGANHSMPLYSSEDLEEEADDFDFNPDHSPFPMGAKFDPNSIPKAPDHQPNFKGLSMHNLKYHPKQTFTEIAAFLFRALEGFKGVMTTSIDQRDCMNLLGLLTSTSWDHAKYFAAGLWLGKACTSMLIGIEAMFARVAKYFNFFAPQMDDPSSYTPAAFVSKGVKAALHSPATKQIVGLVTTIASLMAFGENPAVDAVLSVTAHYLKGAGLCATVAEQLTGLIVFWEERAREFGETGNPWTLFGMSREDQMLQKMEECIKTLESFRNEPTPEMGAALVKGRSLYVSANKFAGNPVILALAVRLQTAVASLEENFRKARTPPIGMILTGPSGSGKTTMAETFHKCMRTKYRLSSDCNIMHVWQSGKHQRLAQVASIILLNDVATTKDEHDKAQMSFVDLSQQLVDSAPVYTEGASIEEKANGQLAPDMVVMTTNARQYIATTMSCGAGKMDRRYWIVEFSWTDYANRLAAEWGCLVAQAYERATPSQATWMVRYTVGWMNNTEPDGSSKNVINFEIKFKEFETLNSNEVVAFFIKKERQRASLVRRTETICKVCCVPRSECECAWSVAGWKLGDEDCPFEEQGQGMSMPVTVEVEGGKENLSWVANAAVIMMGAIAASVLVRSILDVVKHVQAPAPLPVGHQGNIGFVANLPEEMRKPVYVQPFAATAAAWLRADGDVPLARIEWETGGNLHAYPVTHSVLAVPNHFWKAAVEGATFSVHYAGIKTSFKYTDAIRVKIGPDMSCVYVGMIPQLVHVGYKKLVAESCFPGETVSMKGRPVRMSGNPQLLYADPQTVVGDCGHPLIGKSGAVYGLHTGVYTVENLGVSQPLSQRMVDHALAIFERTGFMSEHFSNEVPKVLADQMASCEGGAHPSSDLAWSQRKEPETRANDHHVLCHNKFTSVPHFSVKRSTVYSAFSHMIKEEYGNPYGGKAKEVDGVWVGPFINRYRNTCTNPKLDQPLMARAVKLLIEMVPHTNTRLTPYSDAVAMEGSPESVLVNARDNDKSLGPLFRLVGVNKKNGFVQDATTGNWAVDPKILDAIAVMTAEIEGDGPLTPTVCEGALKDEAYPVSKAAAGKGRLFYVQDWTMNHLMRRYALPIMQHLMMHPFETGVVVVLNAASPAWGSIAEFLKGDSGVRKIYAGDQSAYDMRHSVMIAHYISFMVGVSAKLGYSAKEQRCLKRVLFKASRYLILLEGNWVLSSRTLGSGRSDTIVFNCIVIGLLTYYSSLSVYPDVHPRKVVLHTATGDDSNMSVSPEYPLLDGEVFVRCFAEAGYVLTDSDKKSDLRARPLEDIDYLKRGFKQVRTELGTFWFAPLAKESVGRSMCYSVGVSPKDMESRDLSTAQSALREMFLHGEEEYDKFGLLVAGAFGGKVEVPSWRKLLSEYCSGILGSWSPVVPVSTPSEPCPETYVTQGRVADHSTSEATSEKHHASRGAVKDFPVSKPTPEASKQNGGRNTIATDPTNLNAVTELELGTTAHPVQEVRVVDTESINIKPAAESLREPAEGVDLAAYFARPRKIAELSSAIAGSVPLFATWKALPGVDKILNQYSLFRGDAVVTVVWTGSSQYMGLIRCAAFPKINGSPYGEYEGDGPVTSYNFNASKGFITDSMLPHVDIDASEPMTYVMSLPFPLGREYMETQDSDWVVRQTAVNPIKMANGNTPPASTVNYYLHYENFKMDRIVEQMAPGPREAPPGYLERAFAYANQVSSLLPVQYKAPVQLVSEIGEKVAKYFGLSKPPVEPQTTTVVRHFGNSALASGQPDFGYSLGIDPDAQRSVAPGIIPLSQEGETSFKSITERPCHLVRDWSPGTVMRVVPGAYGLDPAPVAKYFLTPLGYASGAFQYWTGSIKLCVEIKSSPLIRWRIGVNIVPPDSTAPSAYVSDGSLHGYVIESVGSTCTEIEVPYLYEDPWTPYEMVNWFDPAGVHTRVIYFPLMDSVGPALTPVTPEVNLYISAGSSFSAAVPTLDAFEPYTPQMDPGSTGLQAVETFGEVISDLNLLTRRQVMSNVFTLQVDPVNTITFPVNGLDPGAPFHNNLPAVGVASVELSAWTYKYWLSLMFLGSTGGSTFKVHIKREFGRDGVVTLVAKNVVPSLAEFVPNQGVNWETLTTTSRGATAYDEELQFAELVVPDRNTFRWRYARGNYDSGTESAECLQIHSFTPLTQGDRVSIWQGAADDYRVGGFLATPVLLRRNNVV